MKIEPDNIVHARRGIIEIRHISGEPDNTHEKRGRGGNSGNVSSAVERPLSVEPEVPLASETFENR